MKAWKETFKKATRAMKVLGIPTQMMDTGIGIHMSNKLVRLEEQLKEVRVMSNEDIGKKTSLGEPSGPWSKKSENKEGARSQEVMIDKNGTCDGKESHERREKVKESELSILHFSCIPLMLGDATRDYSCDNSICDSRMNDYYSCVANVDSFVLGVENKEEHMLGVLENKKKELRERASQSSRRNNNELIT
ncbi:hypothetical protein M9H77_12497 [Catharanthus roseus]|uniref:Uncharacterized protein n=1 Tax=Catharanthus roseus TaxID=4058 RepID=A0ACC0BHQ9_CATRO|nr:hypothetical protein M9H77_12497 [Catharanthus roseus]